MAVAARIVRVGIQVFRRRSDIVECRAHCPPEVWNHELQVMQWWASEGALLPLCCHRFESPWGFLRSSSWEGTERAQPPDKVNLPPEATAEFLD